MQNPLGSAGLFLINTIFDLYLFILVLRVLLAYARADYFNPLSQFIIKLTQPIVTPVRRFIPNYRLIESASIVWILIIEMLKFSLIGLLIGVFPNILGLVVLAVADSIKLLLSTFFYAILAQAILSWIQPGGSPITAILSRITSPIMRPLRRIIPPVAGFDITPIPALIILQLLIIIIAVPLIALGTGLAFG